MTAAAKPTALTFMGIALEVTPGTPVAASFYIPVTKLDPQDNQNWLDDLGWRGSMAELYAEVAGVVSSEIQCGGDVYADSIAWALAGIMGDVTVTGAGAPFTTTYALLNSSDGQPPSYTLHDNYVANARKYAGCKWGSLTLKAAAEQTLTWDAVLHGFASATETKPTQSFTAVTMEPAWEGTCTIGGAAKAYMEDFQIDLVRKGAGPIFNIDGNTDPYEIFLGALQCSGTATIIMEDDTELNRFVGGSKGTTSLDLDFTHGAGASLVEVKAHMSNVQYVMPTKVERGKEYVQLSITWKAIANSTDVGASGGLSPCKFTTQNALASGTVK